MLGGRRSFTIDTEIFEKFVIQLNSKLSEKSQKSQLKEKEFNRKFDQPLNAIPDLKQATRYSSDK